MTSTHTVAAREKAIRDLEELLATAADKPRTADQIRAVAERYWTQRQTDGWHHTSEHSSPPAAPQTPDPPNDEWRRARADLEQRIHTRSEEATGE